MHQLAAGIYSRHTKEKLKRFIEELELVMVDLDECIFPGITTVTMYRKVCLSLILSWKLENYVLLARLVIGAVAMGLMQIGQSLSPDITNKALIFFFARIIKPIPVSYLQKAVKSIPGGSYAGARETLELLSEKANLGIISQGLDVVLKEYVKQFTGTDGSVIDFWDANVLSALISCRSQAKPETVFICGREDKEAPARKRIAQFNPRRMMVIGHNTDDLGMMKVVKEHDGIIVGFNPTARIKRLCDVVVTGRDWMGLRQMFQEVMCEVSPREAYIVPAGPGTQES